MNKYAYISFITNVDYLPGLKVLFKSLKRSNPKYPFYLVLPDDADEYLTSSVIKYTTKDFVIKMPRINTRDIIERTVVPCWKDTFFKLNVARLTQFEKVIMLDLDMMILGNIDLLFDYPHLSAVAAGQIAHPDWIYLNSGLLVIEPNVEYFERLVTSIGPVINKTNGKCGDQDVFIDSIPDWPSRNELHIPEQYNASNGLAKMIAKKLESGWKGLKVIHFWGGKKPWNYSKIELIRFYISNSIRFHFDLVNLMMKYRYFLNKK